MSTASSDLHQSDPLMPTLKHTHSAPWLCVMTQSRRLSVLAAAPAPSLLLLSQRRAPHLRLPLPCRTPSFHWFIYLPWRKVELRLRLLEFFFATARNQWRDVSAVGWLQRAAGGSWWRATLFCGTEGSGFSNRKLQCWDLTLIWWSVMFCPTRNIKWMQTVCLFVLGDFYLNSITIILYYYYSCYQIQTNKIHQSKDACETWCR